MGIINAAPLSMGLYSPLGPPDWHRAPANVKTAVKEAFEYCNVKFNNSKIWDLMFPKWSSTQTESETAHGVVSLLKIEISVWVLGHFWFWDQTFLDPWKIIFINSNILSLYFLFKAHNVNLTKLAFNFSINQQADMTIVSNSSENILRDNVEFLHELSDREKQILDHLRKK